MKEIQLSVTIDEANVLLGALGNLPYVQVRDLIEKIQHQAASQLQEQQNGIEKELAKKETVSN